MIDLSDTQAALLNAAAVSNDGSTTISKEARNSAAGLIKRGLALAIPHSDGASRLLITSSGRRALGLPDTSGLSGPTATPIMKLPDPIDSKLPAVMVTKSPGGKIAVLIGLLRRPGGVALDEMMDATGWQAHSVRGALSGAIKKKRGLVPVSTAIDGKRFYSLGADVQS